MSDKQTPAQIPLPTKEELTAKYGSEPKTFDVRNAFFARSYEEDCFVMGNGRNFEKLEWEIKNNSRTKYVTAYVRSDKIVKIFE